MAIAQQSAWVGTSVTGRLLYTPDAEGDRVMDFSSAGYQGSGVEAIPENVQTKIVVSPVPGDDTQSIQAAIDLVSSMPLVRGYRGAVELTAGAFDIDTFLEIRASGVVLRGAGDSHRGTILRGRSAAPEGNNQRSLLRISGSGGMSSFGGTSNVIDKVAPAGSTSFRVDNTSRFQVGDMVRVTKFSNEDWVSELGMDMIPPDGGPLNQWSPSSYTLRYDRRITRIEGNRIFFDAPIADAIEQRYGGGTLQKYTASGAIENIGVEGIRAESDFDDATDEDHAWEFITVGSDGRAQNVWIRNIHGRYFGDSLVAASPNSKWVTVQNAVNEEPRSKISGGRRYTFDLSGELGLVTNASADEGRHDFVNNGSRPRGPNVFHNSIATNANADSGPHQRWATGSLFDNVVVEGNGINVRNRGNSGTGHGWSGANMVIWNSSADTFTVQNPQTSQNWLVGSTGTIVENTSFGPQAPGYYDSHGTQVVVGGETSLYDAQMNDARDITSFAWGGGVGNWLDDLGWAQGVVPAIYEVSQRDYLIGDVDDFTFDGTNSDDDLPVDPAWEAQILGSSGNPISGFDDVSGNKNIAFTFQHPLDPGERVINASLALSMIKSGGVLTSDFIRLFDFSPENETTFSELGWDTLIDNSDSFVGLLDFGIHLDELQDGEFSVQLNDDVGVDWAMYVAAVATPVGNASTVNATIAAGEAIIDSNIGNVGSLTVGDAVDGVLRIEPGGSVNLINYTQINGGTLHYLLNESTSGILRAVDAVLDGTLALELEQGFSPIGGESWTLLSSSGSITGQFSDASWDDLDPHLRWSISQTDGLVTARVILAGDYNGDGMVDAADYTLWRNTLGSTGSGLAADGNGDWLVDARDYDVWRANFGNTAITQTVNQTGVPEPKTLILFVLAVMLVLGLTSPRSYRTRKVPCA